jgi:hypothetical protein
MCRCVCFLAHLPGCGQGERLDEQMPELVRAVNMGDPLLRQFHQRFIAKLCLYAHHNRLAQTLCFADLNAALGQFLIGPHLFEYLLRAFPNSEKAVCSRVSKLGNALLNLLTFCACKPTKA